ncbi:hypothetical protein HK101_009442 [Irineochytrium annulatum]|nr:hypothetical protein HK101_009442 [Irineochytrium annulatum]
MKASETGQTNAIVTLYELVHGDAAEGYEFYGLDETIMKRILEELVKQGKGQIFYGSSDADMGFKFG